MRNTFRHGDTMIAVESQPATIAFDDLLAATKIVADNENTTPWDNCDGFEHTATPERRLPDEMGGRKMQGSVYSNREHLVIQLPAGEDYGIYQYMREHGASRQVAREAVAAGRRQTIDQLVKWYSDGWEWYGVQCEFEVLGNEYEASLWGIDNPDYAEREVKEEMAHEVARQLEKAGYTVTGQPDRQGPYLKHRREVKQERLTRNLAAQNWAA